MEKWMDLVISQVVMVKAMMGNGNKIKKMELEDILGLMIVNIKVNIKKIKDMAKGKWHIVMVNIMMGSGKMDKKMAKVTLDLLNKVFQDFGNMDN